MTQCGTYIDVTAVAIRDDKNPCDIYGRFLDKKYFQEEIISYMCLIANRHKHHKYNEWYKKDWWGSVKNYRYLNDLRHEQQDLFNNICDTLGIEQKQKNAITSFGSILVGFGFRRGTRDIIQQCIENYYKLSSNEQHKNKFHIHRLNKQKVDNDNGALEEQIPTDRGGKPLKGKMHKKRK